MINTTLRKPMCIRDFLQASTIITILRHARNLTSFLESRSPLHAVAAVELCLWHILTRPLLAIKHTSLEDDSLREAFASTEQSSSAVRAEVRGDFLARVRFLGNGFGSAYWISSMEQKMKCRGNDGEQAMIEAERGNNIPDSNLKAFSGATTLLL